MPRRASLSETQVVVAALQLIDADGPDNFTLSNVANRLGIRAPSLYTYIDSKEHLVELIRDEVVKEIDSSAFRDQAWPDALATWARSYLGAFAQHPRTVPILALNPVQGDVLIAQYETVAEALLRAGFPGRDVMPAITAVESFVLGSVLDLAAPEIMVRPRSSTYPTLAKVLSEQTPERRALQAFDIGLEALIAGLVTHLRRVS